MRFPAALVALMLFLTVLPGLAVGQSDLPTYVLGPGDVVEVSVFGNEDLSRTIPVRPDGMISLPLIGEVKAAGLTPEQLRQQVTTMFARYVKNPQVVVIVRDFRKVSVRVTILGQIGRQGRLDLEPGARLLDAIAAAGGLSDTAGLGEVRLVREGAPPRTINIERMLVLGDLSDNVTLQPGDLIIVPEDLSARVFLLGEVGRPGVYPLRGKLTVIQVVVQAGGPTPRAKLSNSWLVRRTELAGPWPAGQKVPEGTRETSPGVFIIPLNLQRVIQQADLSQDLELRRGDILFIPENIWTLANILQWLNFIGRILRFF
jgi:polysaccharide export outer membrane protein